MTKHLFLYFLSNLGQNKGNIHTATKAKWYCMQGYFRHMFSFSPFFTCMQRVSSHLEFAHTWLCDRFSFQSTNLFENCFEFAFVLNSPSDNKGKRGKLAGGYIPIYCTFLTHQSVTSDLYFSIYTPVYTQSHLAPQPLPVSLSKYS